MIISAMVITIYFMRGTKALFLMLVTPAPIADNRIAVPTVPPVNKRSRAKVTRNWWRHRTRHWALVKSALKVATATKALQLKVRRKVRIIAENWVTIVALVSRINIAGRIL